MSRGRAGCVPTARIGAQIILRRWGPKKRREAEGDDAGRSSGQLMGKGIKDEEVTVKVEKRIFAAVKQVRQQQHD